MMGKRGPQPTNPHKVTVTSSTGKVSRRTMTATEAGIPLSTAPARSDLESRFYDAKTELFRAVRDKLGDADFYLFLKLSEQQRGYFAQQLNLTALYDSYRTAYIDFSTEREGSIL